MGLGGILDEGCTFDTPLLTDTDGAGADAIGLLRATGRRLAGLGPRLLPHADARQVMAIRDSQKSACPAVQSKVNLI